jgi:RNA polymerase sigma-70 factor, ECF subfamily
VEDQFPRRQVVHTYFKVLSMSASTVEFTQAAQNHNANPADALEEVTTLMSERLPYFHRVALRRLNNMADAEDAVQDAFLSAWKNLDKFRGQARMSTWMTVVVMNSARMIARKRARFPVSLECQDLADDSISLLETLPDLGLDPETEVRRDELRQRLAGLAELLSPRLREVVHLGIKGLSLREAAEELGVSISAVKSRAMRARAELRRLDRSQPVGVIGSAPGPPKCDSHRARR